MNNFPIWILLVLAAGLGALLLIMGNIGTEAAAPSLVNLARAQAEMPTDLETAGRPLFDSESGTFALLRVVGETPHHVHHESNEIVYVMSGSGTASSGEAEYEIKQGDLVIFFAGSPMHIRATSGIPLDLLIFLTPPSNENNVTRFESADEFVAASTGQLQPIQMHIPTRFRNELSNSELNAEQLQVANFSPTGQVTLQIVRTRLHLSKSTSDRALYVLSGNGTMKSGGYEFGLEPGSFLILPAERTYRIDSVDSDLEAILYQTPLELDSN